MDLFSIKSLIKQFNSIVCENSMRRINKFMFLIYMKPFKMLGLKPFLQLFEAASCGSEEVAVCLSAWPQLKS